MAEPDDQSSSDEVLSQSSRSLSSSGTAADILLGSVRGARSLALSFLCGIPRDENGHLTLSHGSALHPEGCLPCMWYIRRKGCYNGLLCEMCHCEHSLTYSQRRRAQDLLRASAQQIWTAQQEATNSTAVQNCPAGSVAPVSEPSISRLTPCPKGLLGTRRQQAPGRQRARPSGFSGEGGAPSEVHEPGGWEAVEMFPSGLGPVASMEGGGAEPGVWEAAQTLPSGLASTTAMGLKAHQPIGHLFGPSASATTAGLETYQLFSGASMGWSSARQDYLSRASENGMTTPQLLSLQQSAEQLSRLLVPQRPGPFLADKRQAMGSPPEGEVPLPHFWRSL